MVKYRVRLVWSEEDGSFAVIVPGLPGCVTQGGTREEALANAEEAIALWLDASGMNEEWSEGEEVFIEVA